MKGQEYTARLKQHDDKTRDRTWMEEKAIFIGDGPSSHLHFKDSFRESAIFSLNEEILLVMGGSV